MGGYARWARVVCSWWFVVGGGGPTIEMIRDLGADRSASLTTVSEANVTTNYELP